MTNKYLASIFAQDGPLANNIENYKIRENQVKLSEHIYNALKENQICICEAGTGTGKTFAYLIPAILLNKKVIISTGTKTLQDQLYYKDIPNLLKILNVNKTKVGSLKGFANYVCSLHCSRALALDKSDDRIVKQIRQIFNFQEQLLKDNNQECNFCQKSAFSSEQLQWLNAHKCFIQSDKCLHKQCPYFLDSSCFVYAARDRAYQSNILVTNHSLLSAGLSIGYQNFFPNFNTVIIDEAHSFCDNVRSFLTQSVSFNALKNLLKLTSTSIEKYITIGLNNFIKIIEQTDIYNIELLNYIVNTCVNNKYNFLQLKYLNYDENLPSNSLNDKFLDIYNNLLDNLKIIAQNLEATDTENMEIAILLQEYNLYISIMSQAKDLDKSKTLAHNIGVVEIYKSNYSISLTPIDISFHINNLFEKVYESSSVIMLSATLAVDDSFDNFADEIGLNELYDSYICPTLFDYKNNARLFIADTFPDVKEPKRIEYIINTLENTIRATSGGVLFLTTTTDALNRAYEILQKKFGSERMVLSQISSPSLHQTITTFKQKANAILIGTGSLWEGVDIPGKALSLVIIDKLPFIPIDDPLYKACAKMLENNNQSSFYHLQMPFATITLRQGVGRLIRNEQDKGAVIICDPRIVQKRYGKNFIKALPKMTISENLDQINQFLKEI